MRRRSYFFQSLMRPDDSGDPTRFGYWRGEAEENNLVGAAREARWLYIILPTGLLSFLSLNSNTPVCGMTANHSTNSAYHPKVREKALADVLI